MGTSNVGLGSNWLRRAAMAMYGRRTINSVTAEKSIRTNVQKVGGYHTKNLRRSQLLPNPTLEVPITWAYARASCPLAYAQVMGTSNVGLGSNWLRRGAMAIYLYRPLYGSGFIFDRVWGVDE